tara:strand:- start:551 stop:1546 length:996 start_codon:yes stop_codon:yes gene_type:complete
MNKYKLIYIGSFVFIIFILIYFMIGFYIANSILKIDHSCGLHQDSLPNTWSTKIDHHEYTNLSRSNLRKNFPVEEYHLDDWQEVYFSSREKNIKISGFLFNYFPNKPIVIVIHGIFPNGKCKPESNLIASLLIKNKINALTIDLRNYGQSTKVSNYENLGLSEYKDVLGAFDFLHKIGFSKNKIGLHGISLGATSAIFAAKEEKTIQAVWLDSSLAEFKMILKDEISRYGLPHDFGPAVSFAGKLLTGIDPTKLSPALALNTEQNYFFTHGENDLRIPVHHFNFIKRYAVNNNIKSDFWLAKKSYHVDSMFKYSEEYGLKMKNFFESNLER